MLLRTRRWVALTPLVIALVLGGSVAAARVGTPVAPKKPARAYFFNVRARHENRTRRFCAAHPCGPEKVLPVKLTLGTAYLITVKGAVSLYSDQAWYHLGPCGPSSPDPTYPSPHATATPAGADPEFVFATPKVTSSCPKLPYKSTLFVVKLTRHGSWVHLVPMGDPARPTKHHVYVFKVVGRGYRPAFRYFDYHPSDNDGEFRISIAKAPVVKLGIR